MRKIIVGKEIIYPDINQYYLLAISNIDTKNYFDKNNKKLPK